MNHTIRALAGAGLCCLAGVSGAEAEVFSMSVPAMEGVRYSYGAPTLYVDVDFGMPFEQVNSVTLSLTGTGRQGIGYVHGDLLNPGIYGPYTLEAEILAGIMREEVGRGTYLGLFGPFDDTPATFESTKVPSYQFADGRAQFYIEANSIISLIGQMVPTEPSYVDIESFIVTIEGVTSASVGDPTGDGFVGIADLNLVLRNWNTNSGPCHVMCGGQEGDLDGDGFVGLSDLNIVLGNWNAGTPPTDSVAIPEPTALTVLTILCGGALVRRRALPLAFR
jgi:hypothetical protein